MTEPSAGTIQAHSIIRRDHGKVRVLLLDRPPSNSLNLALLEALGREAEQAGRDPSVRCVLIGSTTTKYFSSGLDLDEFMSRPEQDRNRLFEQMIATHRKLAAISKPTLAAIEGYALLGGFILTLGCDWRCLSEAGKVGLSEVRLGLSPTTPLLRLVCALTGKPGLVKQLVMQGKTLKAQEALEAGLVDELLPAEGFMDNALREAERLAKLAPAAYASIKRAMRASLLPDEDALWKQGSREFYELFSGEEAQEGLRAMKEKRKPRWE